MEDENEIPLEKTQDELFSERARSELRVENGEIICDNSPLSEADPKSLDELFSRFDSSLKLEQIPDEDTVNEIVFRLRQQRQKFLSEEAAKPVRSATEKKQIAAKKKAGTIKSVKQALSLADL